GLDPGSRFRHPERHLADLRDASLLHQLRREAVLCRLTRDVAGSGYAGLGTAGRRHGVEEVLLRRRARILGGGKGCGIARSDDAATVFPLMSDGLPAREQRGWRRPARQLHQRACREGVSVRIRLGGHEVDENELPWLRVARVVGSTRAAVRIADRIIAG